jgi:hypothetical protein
MKNLWTAALALVLSVSCGSDDPAPSEGTGGSGGGGSGGAVGSGGANAGCSDDPGKTGAYPCDVGAIIEAKCQRCHQTEDALSECHAAGTCVKGPFSLLTWADTRVLYGGTPVYEHIPRVVKSGAMPFMASDISPPVEALTESEKTTLIEWAEGCAPPAAAACR